MMVNVTALGSATGDVGGAVAAVLDYLEGRGVRKGKDRAGAMAGPAVELPAPGGGAVGYYADSVEGPGSWTGRGFAGVTMAGEVNRGQLARLLHGQDPRTGVQWRPAPPPPLAATAATMSLPAAARMTGVTDRHMRRVAQQSRRAEIRRLVEVMAGTRLTAVSSSYLAVRDDPLAGRVVAGSELARWQEERRRQPVVIGYDVTFSAPKSVSILWAAGDDPIRDAVLAAVDAAVDAGVAYLEVNAVHVRRDGRLLPADGMLATSYLHGTSRALDPQLHRHVVIANMTAAADGDVRTLDGKSLWDHGKTAGYLAGAELRWQLTQRLGTDWEPVVNGLADVAGVSRDAIVAMSTRSQEIEQAAAALGVSSAKGRQIAAYATRSAKDKAVDPDSLRPWWQSRLAEHGFDDQALAACLGQAEAVALTAEEQATLLHRAGTATGVTEFSNTFDRGHVIQWLVEHAPRPLPAAAVEELADRWLASEAVLALDPAARRGARRTGDLFTTTAMVEVERSIGTRFTKGLDTGAGQVPRELAAAAIARRPTLGDDQAELVRAITTSGHRIQCVVGPAGTGKTFALEVAAWAWTQAGYHVTGAAVQGTAAEVLGRATGIEASTLESLLWRLDTAEPGRGPLDERSVVLVDEASTIGTRNLDRLLRHVDDVGATVRLIGDPAQHSAVTAGGTWRWLVDHNASSTPELTELRRQAGPELAEVRLAFADYRDGRIRDALERLDNDQRVVAAPTADDLLDQLVADWYVDRRTATDRELAPSSMVAEHHRERVELNRRARVLLAADGTLTGPALTAAGTEFRAGDQVIARRPDRNLRPDGGDRHSSIRNGTRGTVLAVDTASQALVVDFDHRGPITVPHDYLTVATGRGKPPGGLAHAYALTSHAAQGETYEAGRHLATDRSSRKGVYVGLTRGKTDVRLYTVARQQLPDPDREQDHMPRLTVVDERPVLKQVAERLEAGGEDLLVAELDPHTAAIPAAFRDLTLTQLDERSAGDPLAAAAVRVLEHRVAAQAVHSPNRDLVARLGSRPDPGPLRRHWDHAVGATAVYNARHGADPAATSTNGSATAERLAAIVEGAEVTLLAARSPRRLIEERAAAADGDPARVGRIREASARQVDLAVRYPALYLLDLLGPRPTDNGDGAAQWDRLARRLERYRHETLGLAPGDGPVGTGIGLDAVVGPAPADPAARAQYRGLVRHVAAAGQDGQQRLHLQL